MEVGELCFPELLNMSCKKPTLSWSEAMLVHIVLSSISLLTVVLNLLVIISIFHFRKLHTPTNILLLSLAVSDSVVGLVLLPGEVLQKTSCWYFGDVLCSLYNYVTIIISFASVVNMVLISVDRYVAICDPLHYTTRITVRRVKLCICLCWSCSVVYSSVFVKDDLTQPDRHSSCTGDCEIIIDEVEGLIDIVATFFIPVIIIVVLYMRVFVVAVSQARAMRSHITAVNLQHSVTPTTNKYELKAARTLGILVIVFLICYLPAHFMSITGSNTLHASSAPFVIYLFYFHSCMNPVIYALFYPWFRKAINQIVRFKILQPGSRDANIL